MWHPDCHPAARVAERIRGHFGTHRFRNVVGGAGVDVVFQGTLGSGAPAPLPVTWDAECPIAVVAMIDQSLVEDPEWVEYLGDLGQHAATEGRGARLFPVTMEPGVLDDLPLREQAIRWDEWGSATEAPEQRLMRELAYEFARMLRRHLHLLRLPDGDEPQLEQYLQKIQTFLSYSKHDGHGKDIAEAIRCWLYQNSALSSFLDVYDIPAGLPFPDVIDHHIVNSIFLAIQTDSYSSREWCRREVIEAKRKGVPMIVVDCLHTGDERAFPYLGNVPVVRMDPVTKDHLPEIAGRLLDEVLVDFLWRCRVEVLPERRPDTVFMARPPELVSLATLAVAEDMRKVVVYPDPPLDIEELRLLGATWSDLRIRTMTQWLAEEPS
jgi:hypothetical protein